MPGTEDGPGPVWQARGTCAALWRDRRPAGAGSPTWRRRAPRRATARRGATWPPPRSRTVAPPARPLGPGGGASLSHASRSMTSRPRQRPGHSPGVWRAGGAPLKNVKEVVTTGLMAGLIAAASAPSRTSRLARARSRARARSCAVRTTCGTQASPGASTPVSRPPEVAAWAGHSVEVLMRVYARCVTGLEDVWISRMDGALRLQSGPDTGEEQ
jgi:hypothetical protein